MSRCKSWRPTGGPPHDGCLPGRCHRHWEPRRRTVAAAENRCRDCWAALAASSDTAVKEALLVEPDLPGWALDQLAADPDDYIAMLAQSRRPSPPSDT
jgi:hypothetical protein